MPLGKFVLPAVIAIYYNKFSNSLLNEIPYGGLSRGIEF